MDIFTLIHSMSTGDKRHFSIISNSKSEKTKKYIALYKAILKQNSFDEQALKKTFGFKYYTQLKHELSKHVLDSLRNNYLKTNDASTLLNISNAHTLLNHSLWIDALKQIDKVFINKDKNVSSSFIPLSDLAYIKSRCSSEKDIKETIDDWDALSDQLIDKIKTESRYDKLYLKITLINQQIESVRTINDKKRLIEFIENPLLKEASFKNHKAAELNYNYVKGLAYYLLGEFEKAYEFMNKAKEILEKEMSLRIKREDLYIRISANLCLCSIQNNKLEIAIIHQKKIHDYTCIFKSNNGYKQYLSNLIYLMILNVKQDYKKAVFHLSKKINKTNKSIFQNRLTQEKQYEIFQTIYTLIGLELFKDAKRIVLEYIIDNKKSSKKDAYGYARILYLIILLEINDDILLFSELKSVKRYFTEQNKMNVFERTFIDFSLEILKHPSKPKKRVLYDDLYNRLEELKNNPLERNAFIYYDFASWAKNKRI